MRHHLLPTALLVLGACHYHRSTNAPGVIDPATPPVHVAQRGLEYPGDPGERMVVVSTGVLGAIGVGEADADAFVDVAAEATVRWGENPTTHNHRLSRLIMPSSVVLPDRSWGVSVGWSALRVNTESSAVSAGPIYVEAQRSWLFAGAGAGWAIDPRTGATGPQAQGYFTFYFARARYLFGGGWEGTFGLQFKWPTTWTWQR